MVHSVAFGYRDLEQWLAVAQGRSSGHIYSRNTNPTVAVLEQKLLALEKRSHKLASWCVERARWGFSWCQSPMQNGAKGAVHHL